jgi:HAD superfamily phosphatase (TIGR01668 family)
VGFSLLPHIMADSLTDISPSFLKSKDIRLLMLDFDNTIVPYTTNVPTAKMQVWLETMLESDISLCVVSNSRNDRVKLFCEKYGLACVTNAKKPFSKGIHQCMEMFEIDADFCALAGDQIYTDVLGANCAGVRSVLVRSIHNHTFWLKLRHIAELPFIFAAKKRRIHYE